MIERYPDWPERLKAAIEDARDLPFAWGTNDCVMFACNVMLEITGVDFAHEFRGSYDDRRGAMRALQKCAGLGLEALADHLAAKHDIAEVPVAFAQRGDVMLLDTPTGPALGICIGGEVAAPQENASLAFVPAADARRAWALARSVAR